MKGWERAGIVDSVCVECGSSVPTLSETTHSVMIILQ